MKKSLTNRVYTNQEEPLKVVSIRLSNWHIRKAKKVGDGSFTDGIRKVIEQYVRNI